MSTRYGWCVGDRCWTMKIVAFSDGGSCTRIRGSASTPPAEHPVTMMSRVRVELGALVMTDPTRSQSATHVPRGVARTIDDDGDHGRSRAHRAGDPVAGARDRERLR